MSAFFLVFILVDGGEVVEEKAGGVVGKAEGGGASV